MSRYQKAGNDRMQDVAKNAYSENKNLIGSALKIGAVLFTAAALFATGDGAEAAEVVSEAFRK
ncbi:MAG: hypothetical protein WBA41_33840 [Rivularia sp. (in: cyanobacteria)]